jgi:hypothetical protein
MLGKCYNCGGVRASGDYFIPVRKQDGDFILDTERPHCRPACVHATIHEYSKFQYTLPVFFDLYPNLPHFLPPRTTLFTGETTLEQYHAPNPVFLCSSVDRTTLPFLAPCQDESKTQQQLHSVQNNPEIQVVDRGESSNQLYKKSKIYVSAPFAGGLVHVASDSHSRSTYTGPEDTKTACFNCGRECDGPKHFIPVQPERLDPERPHCRPSCVLATIAEHPDRHDWRAYFNLLYGDVHPVPARTELFKGMSWAQYHAADQGPVQRPPIPFAPVFRTRGAMEVDENGWTGQLCPKVRETIGLMEKEERYQHNGPENRKKPGAKTATSRKKSPCGKKICVN